MIRTRKGIAHQLSLSLGFLLLAIQMAGCSAGNKESSVAAILSNVPPPYLSTGFPQVVLVAGTNHEMGIQYGEQASAAIVHNLAVFKSRLYDAYGSQTVIRDMQVWDYYLEKYDPAYKEWLQGIMEGCRQRGKEVSYLDLVALVVYPTELWARPKTPYPAETKMAWVKSAPVAALAGTYHSCNSFAATGTMTPDGQPIHGITSMAETEMMDNIILVAFPKDGVSFAAQTYAGRVTSNFAMNSRGLASTMTAILSDTPVWGIPPEAYCHYLAQIATSPAEAIKYIESTPKGGVTGGFILSDGSGNISVYEGTSNHFHMRRPGDRNEPGQFVVQTNHLIDPSLQAYNPKWLESIATYARYNTVYQFLKEAAPGTVDFKFAKDLFASDDWYDASTARWVRNQPGAKEISNSPTSVGQGIFFPSKLTAYFQAGTPSGIGLPAFATGEYVKITLANDPKKVTYQADKDALALYWDARNLFERDLKGKAEFLTSPISNDIRSRLDQAFSAYSLGIDRASFANLETDAKKQTGLWAEAMTHFAKAQLYAQMAETALLKARGNR